VKKLLALLILVSILFLTWFIYTEDKRIIQTTLKLETLPKSIKNIKCQSLGLTDVSTTCRFNIDPLDFDHLLTSWNFKAEKGAGSAHALYAKLGLDFTIDSVYLASPKEFEHGGFVRLVSDESRENVMLDLYIE